MPCARCDSPKISIRGRLACPRCERMRLVPPSDAARTLKGLARRAEKKLVGRMFAYTRDDILTTVFKKREQIAREPRFDRRLMDVRAVLGCSAAIKMITTAKAGFGGRPVGVNQKFPGMQWGPPLGSAGARPDPLGPADMSADVAGGGGQRKGGEERR